MPSKLICGFCFPREGVESKPERQCQCGALHLLGMEQEADSADLDPVAAGRTGEQSLYE